MIAALAQNSKPTATEGWYLKGTLPPDGHMTQISIPDGLFRVGRRPDINLSLPVGSVSKLHAEFVATAFALFVRDTGSTNGTFVNGNRITEDTPVDEGDIVQFAEFEFMVGRSRVTEASQTQVSSTASWMLTLTQFQQLLTNKAVVPHFQPIVRVTDKTVFGYEALARSTVPGMLNPRQMFEAAEQMDRAGQLSVLCRQTGVDMGQHLPRPAAIFLNTHPSENAETDLLPSLAVLRASAPQLPIVLELHEAAMTHPREIREFRAALHDLEIELAYDDFGAGQSRLLELAEVAPDYLKFDMGLIRGIHTSVQRQQIVGGLVKMALDLKIQPLAEGIECVDEAVVCEEIGFTLAQGYFYGKPASVEMFLRG